MSYTKKKKREGYVVRVLPYNVTFLCGSMYIIYHSLFACSLIPQLGCFCNFMVSLVLLSGVIASSFPSVWWNSKVSLILKIVGKYDLPSCQEELPVAILDDKRPWSWRNTVFHSIQVWVSRLQAHHIIYSFTLNHYTILFIHVNYNNGAFG